MNFENAPAQLIALVFGWSFTVFLQYRSNRRAESLKRKDKIIDKLEALAGWVDSEIKKDNFSPGNTEITYSGMISQIEVRIEQLNKHVGRDIFDGTKLARLRNIEIHADFKANTDTPYVIREAAADIVESIEVCCDAEYFSRPGFWAKSKRLVFLLNDYVRAFRGGVLALIIVFLCLAIYQFCHKYLAYPVGTCVYGDQCHLAPGMLSPERKINPHALDKYKYSPPVSITANHEG